ncbi:G2/M phase-specific E3 ubiquitin-protein ligase-like [Pitangus sulphuratus]|nr:G2/M phase-specific E3 ubiquitin-protein ligase-like [Pitangus sulphuratus]
MKIRLYVSVKTMMNITILVVNDVQSISMKGKENMIDWTLDKRNLESTRNDGCMLLLEKMLRLAICILIKYFMKYHQHHPQSAIGDSTKCFLQGMHLGNLKRTHIKTYCNVINIVILEDVSARKEETITNLIAVKENLYFEAGKMIAVCLVHGGPSPGFFSKTLFDCLVYGPENVKPALEDVADVDVAQTIKMIKYANSLSSLQSTIHNCYEFLAAAGCLRPITALCDKNMLVNDILIHHVIKRIISPLESFRQGLKTLGVLEKMQMHPDAFSSILCHKPERLSAETICDLFTIHPSSDVKEVKGADFWMGYLQDVESGESVVTFEDILLFVTGSPSIPSIGFDPEPTIKFLRIRYPIGNRLLNSLELPITKTYQQFKTKMELTIRNTLRVESE